MSEVDGLVYTEIKNDLSEADAHLVSDGLSLYGTDELLSSTTIKRAYCLHNELNYGYVPVRIPIPKNLIPKDEGGTSQCDDWFKVPVIEKMKFNVKFQNQTFTNLGYKDLVSENIQFLSVGDYVKKKGRNDWGLITNIQYGKNEENDSILCSYPYTYITPSGKKGETIFYKAPVMKKYGWYEKWVRVPVAEQKKKGKELEDMGRSCNAFYETYCANINKFYNRHLKRNNDTFNPDKYFQYEGDCACFNYNTAEQGIRAAQDLVDATSADTGPIHCWMVGCNALSVRSEYTKTIMKDGQQKKIYTSYIPSDIRHENVAATGDGQIVTDNASNAITKRDCPKAAVCTVNNVIANNDFAGDVGIEASMNVNCGGPDKVKREPEACQLEMPIDLENGWGNCKCESVEAPYMYKREYQDGGSIYYWENEKTGLQTLLKDKCEKHTSGIYKGQCKKVHKIINNGWGSTTKSYNVEYPPYKAGCPSRDFKKGVDLEASYGGTGEQRWNYVKTMNKLFHSRDCGDGVDSPGNCPIDANVGPWGHWSKCSFPCDGGWQARKRAVTIWEDGGKALPTIDEKSEQFTYEYSEDENGIDYQIQWRKCNPQACICEHKTYWEGKWSECNEPCDGGRQIRWTTVKNPIPADNSNCPFEDELGNELVWVIDEKNAYVENIRACNQHPCDSDCEMGPWSKWSKCESQIPNTYCGPGIKTSTRKVSKFGQGCGSEYREKPCSLKPCPAPPITQLKPPQPEKINYLQRYKEQQEAKLQEMKPIEIPEDEDDTPLFAGLGLALLLCIIVICIMLIYG